MIKSFGGCLLLVVVVGTALQAVDGERKSPSSERGRDRRVRSLLLTCLVESGPFFLFDLAARIGEKPHSQFFSFFVRWIILTLLGVGCLVAWNWTTVF